VSVTLYFDPDSDADAHDRAHNPSSYDEGVLELSFFHRRVHFLVDEVDILGHRKISLLAIGPIGLITIDHAIRAGKARLRLDGGDLFVSRADDQMLSIESIHAKGRVTVKYEELRTTWRSFSEDIRQFIAREFPELHTHPYWGNWLVDGVFPSRRIL